MRRLILLGRAFGQFLGRYGFVESARMAMAIAFGAGPISFRNRGRTYWMARDSSVVYHLTSTVESLRTLASFVDTSATRIVDVGAHSGLFAAFAAERAPGAHVTLVEPDPSLAPVITANMSGHRRWNLVEKAISDRPGRASFFRNGSSTQTSSLVEDAVRGFGGATEEFEVDLTSLDQLLANDTVIDVLKVDVQGAEHQVVAGGAAVLERVRTLLIEMTFLDPNIAEVLIQLRESFGTPERVNLVVSGADLAYRRMPAQAGEETGDNRS